MYTFIKWSIKVIIVSLLAAFVLFFLDMQKLFQWEIVTLVALTILFIFAYKLRKTLRLDKPYVQIQFVDA